MSWIDFNRTKACRLDRVIFDGQQVRVKNTALNAHALVRGAAGSGKSLILCERIARLLRETNYQDILVVTYNRFMAAWVRDLIQCTRNANITCETFNTWASRAVKHDYKNGAKDFEARACHSSLRYDAVLIDEAQDFKDEWFRGILHILKPQTNSLFLVYDNAQSVYKSQHRRRSDWTWKNLASLFLVEPTSLIPAIGVHQKLYYLAGDLLFHF